MTPPGAAHPGPVEISHPSASGADAPSLFGATLEPALLEACRPHLHALQWFRTDWQRGGAATGYALWRDGDGHDHPVVVKLPVPPQELTWLERLQPDRHEHGPIVPRLYAAGRKLAMPTPADHAYDLAWVVMERLTYGPLDGAWEGAEATLLVEAAGRFYAAASRHEAEAPRDERDDWTELLARSRQAIKDRALPRAQRWNAALKSLKKPLKKMGRIWGERDTGHWCHGDLHFGNAMTHHPPPRGPAILFDLALIHCGHWVEDAVYLEHLYWAAPQRLNGTDVVKAVNRVRKDHGLKGDPDWPRLADLRRTLRAAAAPAEQAHRPDPAHLDAALARLESLIPKLP